MGETSTEIPESLIPAAITKAERISHATRRLSAAVQIELIDADLSPADMDDDRREELARLGNELLGFMHLGQRLLRNIVEAGGLGVEENGGGLPLRISAGVGMLELEAPALNGDSETAAPEPEEPNHVAPVAEEAETEEPDEPAVILEPETKADLPDVEVIIDGFAQLDTRDLGLTSIHEVSLLKALPDLAGEPLTRKWMLERGFYAGAPSDTARSQAFSNAAVGLSHKLKEASGGQEILEIVGEKSKRHYAVRFPLKVDGAVVAVTGELKKKLDSRPTLRTHPGSSRKTGISNEKLTSTMTSAEFWKSPIALPKPRIGNSLSRRSSLEKESLPEPIETREEERDGQIFKVTVLPGFTGKARAIPERTTVGNYEVGEDGVIRQFKPNGTETY